MGQMLYVQVALMRQHRKIFTDWLQPLLKRKYPNISFKYTYIDITKDNDNLTDHDLQFIERIEQDELFYPLITMNDEYVADGYIQTKQITRFIDQKLVNE